MVEIRYFAAIADAVGKDRETLDLPAEATVGDLAPDTNLPNPFGLPAVLQNLAVDEDAIRGAVADALGPEARPIAFCVVPAIPMLPSGKPDRAAAAALLRTP